MEHFSGLGWEGRTGYESRLFSKLQYVDSRKIREGFVGLEPAVLYECRFLMGVETWFDAGKKFKSGGLNNFDGPLKRVAHSREMFNCAIGFERSFPVACNRRVRVHIG